MRRDHEPSDPKLGPHIKRLRPQAPPKRGHRSSAHQVPADGKARATASNRRGEGAEPGNKGGARSGIAGAVQALLRGSRGQLQGSSPHSHAVSRGQRHGQGDEDGSGHGEERHGQGQGQAQSQEERQPSGQGQGQQGQGEQGQVHVQRQGHGQELLAAGGSCSLESEAGGSGAGAIELVVGCGAGTAAGGGSSGPVSIASACASGDAAPPLAMPTTANPLFRPEPHPHAPAPGPACLPGQHQQQLDWQQLQQGAHELEGQGGGVVACANQERPFGSHEHRPTYGAAGGQGGSGGELGTGTCAAYAPGSQQQQQQRKQENNPQQIQEEGQDSVDGQGDGGRVAVSIVLDDDRCSDVRSAGVADGRRVAIGGEEVMDPGAWDGLGSHAGSEGLSEQERGPDPLGALLRLGLGSGREGEGEERGSGGTERCGEGGEGRGGGAGVARRRQRKKPPSRYVQLGILKVRRTCDWMLHSHLMLCCAVRRALSKAHTNMPSRPRAAPYLNILVRYPLRHPCHDSRTAVRLYGCFALCRTVPRSWTRVVGSEDTHQSLPHAHIAPHAPCLPPRLLLPRSPAATSATPAAWRRCPAATAWWRCSTARCTAWHVPTWTSYGRCVRLRGYGRRSEVYGTAKPHTQARQAGGRATS